MKRIFLFVMAALFCALTSLAQQANIYASGLKAGAVVNGEVAIDYFLNTDAIALEILFVGSDQAIAATVPVTEAALLTKGAHTATISLEDVPEGTYKWSVKATATANGAAPVKISDDASKFKFYVPMGLAVDGNYESPFFGRIYVAEGVGSAISTNPDYFGDGRVTNDGIYTFDPSLESLNDAAYAGGVSWDPAAGGPLPTTPNTSPARLAIDAAGQIYIADGMPSNSGIWIMDPAHPENAFTNLFAEGTRDAEGLVTVGGEVIHGRVPALYVDGSGDDAILYTIDRNYLPDTYSPRVYLPSGMVFKYDIGSLATPYAAKPSIVYDNAASKLGNDAMALIPDGRGGWWICQSRWNDGAAVPCILHLNDQAIEDYNSASQNILASPASNASYRGAMAINQNGNLLAIGSDKFVKFFSIAYDPDTEIPSLAAIAEYNINIDGTNIDGVSFDVAGNLYAISASTERLYAYAMPKAENTFTTPAPAASTITVEPAGPLGPQANIYASGLKAEKVDATHYKFSYTLNAKATSGKISIKAGTTIDKPLTGANLAKGPHSVTLDVSDVTKGQYEWSVTVAAAPNAAITQVTDDDQVNLKFGGSRAFALDNSFESPGFGRLYFGVGNPGTEAGAGRALTRGVYILDAALEDVTNQGNTAWDGVSFVASGQSSPIKAWAAPDGRVYFSDWSDPHSGAWVMSPTDPTDFGPVFGGTIGAGGVATNSAGEFIHGSHLTNIVIIGEGEEAKMYSVDEDYTSVSGEFSLLVHNIGTAPYPYAGAASLADPFALKNWGSLAPDGQGGFWAAQSRVVDQDIASVPALLHIKSDGSIDYKSGDNADLGAANGGAVATNQNGEYVLVGATKTAAGDSKQVALYWPEFDSSGNLLSLGDPILTVPTWNNETSGVGIDVADNLYAVTGTALGTDKRLVIFALPKANNSFTTPAPSAQKLDIGGTGIQNPNALSLDSRVRVGNGNGFLRLTADGVTIQNYVLYNVAGARIANGKAAVVTVDIPTGHLSAGVYLLQIGTDEGIVVKRIIIK
jgi:hypothetical protein